MLSFNRSIAGQAFWYAICQCARAYPVRDLPKRRRGRLRFVCGRSDKKWPRKPGPSLGGVQGRRAIPPQNQLKIRAYRPKRGISPLRTAMRALDISQPSTVAIRRPNRVLDGASSREAVLDMSIPFCGASKRANHLGTIYVYQMPGTIPLFAWQHKSFCNAKWIDLDFLLKKAADFSATFEFIREFRQAYSAATLRGGSSAPESWISAT